MGLGFNTGDDVMVIVRHTLPFGEPFAFRRFHGHYQGKDEDFVYIGSEDGNPKFAIAKSEIVHIMLYEGEKY